MFKVLVEADNNGNIRFNGKPYLSSGIQVEQNLDDPEKVNIKYLNNYILFGIHYVDFVDENNLSIATSYNGLNFFLQKSLEDNVFFGTIYAGAGIFSDDVAISTQGDVSVVGKVTASNVVATQAPSSLSNTTIVTSNVNQQPISLIGGTISGLGNQIPFISLKAGILSNYSTYIKAPDSGYAADVNINLPSQSAPSTEGSYTMTTDGVTGLTTWTDVSSLGSSPWTESGSNIYYNTGNVGIGTTSPNAKLDVAGDTNAEIILGRARFRSFVDDYLFLSHFDRSSSTDYALKQSPYGSTALNAASGQNVSLNISNSPVLSIIGATGNVGIGTNTPAAKLDISDSNSNIAVFRTTNANADLYLRASGTGSDGKVGIRASDNNLRFISNGATQASFNGSNLGIGTTSPSHKLQVVGNGITASNTGGASVIRADRTDGKILALASGSAGSSFIFDSSGFFGIGPDSRATIEGTTFGTAKAIHILGSNEYVGIGTSTPSDRLDVSGNLKLVNTQDYIKFANDLNTIKRDGANAMRFDSYGGFKFHDTNNNAERVRIDASGNVGIGTTSPNKQLTLHEGVANVNTSLDSRGIYFSRSSDGTYTGSIVSANGNPIYSARNSHKFNIDTELTLAVGETPNISGSGVVAIGSDAIGLYQKQSVLSVGGGVAIGSSTTFNRAATSDGLLVEGNVGIGTTNPTAKLQIQHDGGHTSGTVSYTNATIDLYNPLQADTDEKGSIITFSDNYADSGGYNRTTRAAIKGGTDTTGNTADGFLAFYTDASGANSANERMRIDHDGNVGIGTTTPQQKLQVEGGMRFASDGAGANYMELSRLSSNQWKWDTSGVGEIMRQAGNLTTWKQDLRVERAGLTVAPTLGYAQRAINIDHTWNDVTRDFATIDIDVTDTASSGNSSFIDIAKGGTTGFIVDEDFNVGIGKANPSYKLDIVGHSRLSSGNLFLDVDTSTSNGVYFISPYDSQIQALSLPTYNTIRLGGSNNGAVQIARHVNEVIATFNSTGAQITGDLDVTLNGRTYPSLQVGEVIKLKPSDNGTGVPNADNAAVYIDRGGSTSTDVVALNVGDKLRIKRNGGGTPTFSADNAGFIYTQNYDTNDVSNTNPFNSGAGFGARGSLGSIFALSATNGRPAIFGALNSPGASLLLGNPNGYSKPGGAGPYYNPSDVHYTYFFNSAGFTVDFGGKTTDGDFTKSIFKLGLSGRANSRSHIANGSSIGAVPLLEISTDNGDVYVTNGSTTVSCALANETIRGHVLPDMVIYIADNVDNNHISTGASYVKYTIASVDYANNEFELTTAYSGTTGIANAWIQDKVLRVEGFDGHEIATFYGNDVLRVNGAIEVNNPASTGFRLPTADGTTGQVLSTDGSGTVTWVDQSGGGATDAAFDVGTEAAGRTLVAGDHLKYLRSTSATAVTFTVPPQSSVSWVDNAEIVFEQAGAGQITIAAGSGVTINSSETLKSGQQYAVIGLKRVASDTWTLTGERELAP